MAALSWTCPEGLRRLPTPPHPKKVVISMLGLPDNAKAPQIKSAMKTQYPLAKLHEYNMRYDCALIVAIMKRSEPSALYTDNSYLGGTGKYQYYFDRLMAEMNMTNFSWMNMGTSIANEMIRVCFDLLYDNGLGKNMSSEINFLKVNGVFDGNMHVYDKIYPYASCKKHVEHIVDLTIEYVMDHQAVCKTLTAPTILYEEN